MFNRVAYKKAAKEQFRGRWKIPALTTLFILILISLMSGSLAYVFGEDLDMHVKTGAGFFGFSFSESDGTGPFSILVCFVAAAFFLAQKHLFELMKKNADPVTFSDFVDGLNQWWQAIRGLIWKYIWVWLWSLLFIIPGIVKLYSYSMMDYIMAEYPKIPVRKAMNISKELTRGYKGDLFVTDLTFIPLLLLSIVSCGIGFLWTIPYYQQTYSNIYSGLKQAALDSKRVALEDFE